MRDFPTDDKSQFERIFVDWLAKPRMNGPHMSVTQRSKSVKQPRGGYVKRTDFEEKSLGKGKEELHESENIQPTLIGIAVDYLTRYMLTNELEDSFKISLLGARIIKELETANQLMKGISGIDDQSIINVIKLSGFDVCYRSDLFGYIPVDQINPDSDTIDNVRIMVQRTLNFFEIYGSLVSSGFSFEGGYTNMVAKGDADYLTKDTLWDLKVLKDHFNKNHTMQLLIYWRMGLRSDYDTFKNVKFLGIYNPRQNKVFTYDLSKLSSEIIRIIDEEVIGYTEPLK